MSYSVVKTMALKKLQRIPKGEALLSVLASRGGTGNRFIMLRYRPNGLSVSRFAFVVSKKAARSAVVRNTLKRRASEWVRMNISAITPGFDYALIFRTGVGDAPRRELPLLLKELFKKATLL